jgi:hypothetical protein
LIRSRIALALLAITVTAIIAVTLAPGRSWTTPGLFACIVCGQRGFADIILNIILFMPFGVLAALALGARPAVVIGAGLFSALIELAQVGISGRDASVGDLLFNTTGALLGLLLVGTAARWFRPSRSTQRVAAITFTLLVPGLVVTTGKLSHLSLPLSTWFSLWNPDLRHLSKYSGSVLESSVGQVVLRPAERLEPAARDSARAALLDGQVIRVRAVAGTPPSGIAALLAIYDDEAREILLIGPDQNELVLRLRYVSDELRLDRLDVRVHGALNHLSPGDTFEVAATRRAGDYCLSIDARTTCGLGMQPARGWTLLFGSAPLPLGFIMLVDIGWAVTLAALLGFYARDRLTMLLGALGWTAAFIVMPVLDPYVLAPPLAGMVGAIAGFLTAIALGLHQERTRA